MNDIKNYKILIVDDSPETLSLLCALLSKEQTYSVYQADNAEKAIKIAREIIPDIIISDYYMPGTDGIEFCRQVRNDAEISSSIFILLTAETDISKKINGLEQGIDDYIEKSISAKVLLGKVKAFLKIKTLQNDLIKEKQKLQAANEQLERNVKQLVGVLLKILEIHIPGTSKRADDARAIAEYVTKELELDPEKTKKILFAATLHEIGKIGLPEKIAKADLRHLTQKEIEIYRQFPLVGSLILSTITGYKDAAYDVGHLLENYDGSGTPDGLMKEEISIGARILRAINLQEELFMMGHSFQDAIAKIREAIGTLLDPYITTHLINYLSDKKRGAAITSKKISIEELKSGMVLEEDVYSVSGIKILPKGIKLNDRMVEIIKERNIVDPIVGGVAIR